MKPKCRGRPVSAGPFAGLLSEKYDADLFQKFLSQFETILHGDEYRIIKNSGHTKTAVVSLDLGKGKESFFLKKCGNKGFISRVLEAFRQSKASKAWSMSLRFMEEGIPVTKPVALIEKRHNGLKGESYFLSAFAEEAVNFKAYVNKFGADFMEDGRLLKRIGDAIGRMHRAGCIHGDLKWSNLIVIDPTGDPRPLLVDLEHGRCRHSTPDSERAKDLARFMVDVEETNLALPLSELFIKAYFDASQIAKVSQFAFISLVKKDLQKIRRRHTRDMTRS